MSVHLSPPDAWMRALGGRSNDFEAVIGFQSMVDFGGVALIHGEDDMRGSVAHMWMPSEPIDVDVVMRDFQKQQYAVLTRTHKAEITKLLEKPSGMLLTARTGNSRTVGALLAYDRTVSVTTDTAYLRIDVVGFVNASEQFLYAPLLSAFNAQTLEDLACIKKIVPQLQRPVELSLTFSGPAEKQDRDYLASALNFIREAAEFSAEAGDFAQWDAEQQQYKGMAI